MSESEVNLLSPMIVFQGRMPAVSLVIPWHLSAPLPLSHLRIGDVEQRQNNKHVTRRKAFQLPMGAVIPKLSMQFWSEYGLCVLLCTQCNVVTGFTFDQPSPCQKHCAETLRIIHFSLSFFFLSEFEQT